MDAQAVCDKYANDLFGLKYFGDVSPTMVDFEDKLDFEGDDRHERIKEFRTMVLNKIDMCWVRNTRPLKWDEEPEVKQAIEQVMEN